MNTPIIKLFKFDVTGIDINNKVEGETHVVPAGKKDKMIVPDHGPFYAKSVRIFTAAGAELFKGEDKDFQVCYLYPEQTEKTGKAVSAFIKMSEKIDGEVSLTYQVVGDGTITGSRGFIDILNAIKNDNRPVFWENIHNKPDVFPPSPHQHDIAFETYNWGGLVAIFEQWSKYLSSSNEVQYVDLYARLRNLEQLFGTYLAETRLDLQNHSRDYVNPHNVNKIQIGLNLVDNFATATLAQAKEGLRSDLLLTPQGANALFEERIKEFDKTFVHQGHLRISHYGSLGYLPAGVSGSFEGSSMIEAHDHVAQFVEADGTLVRLRPGTDGGSIGIYYDHVPNFMADQTGAKLIRTTTKYKPSSLPAGFTPSRLIPSGEGILVGAMVNDNDLTQVDAKHFIAITNGTFDSTKHNIVELVNANFVNSVGSSYPLTPGYARADRYGDRIYLFQLMDNWPSSTVVNGAVTQNTESEIGIGYVNVSEILAGTPATFHQITDFNISLYGATYTRKNIVPFTRFIKPASDSGAFAPCTYAGTQRINVYQRKWPGWRIQTAQTSDGKIGMVIGFTLNIDGPSNTVLRVFCSRLTIDPIAKRVTDPDAAAPIIRPIKLIDGTGSLINFDPSTPDNNTGINTQNLLGASTPDPANGSNHSHMYITNKGTVAVAGRTDSSNVYQTFRVMSLTGFTNKNEVITDPAKFGWKSIRSEDELVPYGSAITALPHFPRLFPNNVLVTQNFRRAGGNGPTNIRQPLSGSPNYSYNLISLGVVQGYAPSTNRLDLEMDMMGPLYRTTVTEINGLTIVTHCSAPSSKAPTGPSEITDMGVVSGSVTVDPTELDTQAKRMIAASTHPNVNPDFTVHFTAFRDTGMPCLVQVLARTNEPVPKALILVATVTYGGSRTGDIRGWTANVADMFEDYPGMVTSSLTWYPSNVAPTCTYKLGNGDYLISLTATSTFYTPGPANQAFFTVMRYSGGKITNNPHASSFYAPYWTLGSVHPIAIPNKGFYLTETTLGLSGGMGWALPNALTAKLLGTDINKIVTLDTTGSERIVLISQQVEQGWVVYFTEETPAFMAGNEYTLPIGSIDLRTIVSNPANKTFYLYVTLDSGKAIYRITTTEQPESVWNMQIGLIYTNSSQIYKIDVEKPTLLNGFRISTYRRGSAISVSTGSVNTKGDWAWLNKEDVEALDLSLVPTGVVLKWPSDTPPKGYAIIRGQAFDKNAYPKLATIFPSGVLPDPRDKVFVGLRDGRAVMSFEAGQVKGHTHSAYSTQTDLGTRTTDYDVGHNHRGGVGAPGDRYGDFYSGTDNTGNYDLRRTSTDGAHQHSISGMGAHTHQVIIDAAGSNKNTMDNLGINFIVEMK